MMPGNEQGQFPAGGRHAQTGTHLASQLDAARLVARMARQIGSWRHALAEVVQQHRPANGQRAETLRRLIDDEQHMRAGIHLRMALSTLRYAEKCVEFRQQPRQSTALAQDLEHP